MGTGTPCIIGSWYSAAANGRDEPQPWGGEHRPGATAERQHFTSAFRSSQNGLWQN